MSSKPLDQINGAIGMVRGLVEIKNEMDQLELRQTLVSLQTELLGAKESMLSLQVELAVLQARLSVRQMVINDPSLPYVTIAKNGVAVPYCRFCYEDLDKLYQLPIEPDLEYAHCMKCKNSVRVKARTKRSDNYLTADNRTPGIYGPEEF